MVVAIRISAISGPPSVCRRATRRRTPACANPARLRSPDRIARESRVAMRSISWARTSREREETDRPGIYVARASARARRARDRSRRATSDRIARAPRRSPDDARTRRRGRARPRSNAIERDAEGCARRRRRRRRRGRCGRVWINLARRGRARCGRERRGEARRARGRRRKGSNRR